MNVADSRPLPLGLVLGALCLRGLELAGGDLGLDIHQEICGLYLDQHWSSTGELQKPPPALTLSGRLASHAVHAPLPTVVRHVQMAYLLPGRETGQGYQIVTTHGFEFDISMLV